MRDQDCSGELLRSPTHNGHLLVGALKRHQNKPVLFLGDTRLTGGQLADRISQYIQAFEALGAGTGVAVGLLSLNRPEVLMIIGAGQARGYRRTALHPLGSLADHAYVLNDAGINTWQELADAPADKVQAILDEAGPRYRMHDPATWSKQAKLAAEAK